MNTFCDVSVSLLPSSEHWLISLTGYICIICIFPNPQHSEYNTHLILFLLVSPSASSRGGGEGSAKGFKLEMGANQRSDLVV